MLLKHTAFLRILVSASSLVASVSGHARLIEPKGMLYMTDPCNGECAENVINAQAQTDEPYQDPVSLYKNHWFNQGTTIGCDKPSGTNCEICCDKLMEPTLTSGDQLSYQKFAFSDLDELCELIAPTTFNNSVQACLDTMGPGNEELKTIDAEIAKGNLTASPFSANPWLAPGYAPVEDACGILGGWFWPSARDYIAGPGNAFFNVVTGQGGFINAFKPPVGMDPPAGTSGTDLINWEVSSKMQAAQGDTTVKYPNVWVAGQPVNVSYNIAANHGGGHQYRLCPVENLFTGSFDEACFQANPLDFADGTSVFEGVSEEYGTVSIPFEALDIDDSNTNGVLPTGSTWRRIGIPPCEGGGGGISGCIQNPQFTDHAPPGGIFGYGNLQPPEAGVNSFNMTPFIPDWKVVDTVMVPEDLNGDYVVSWRWDSEQTPQVWTQCAIVSIVDPEEMLGGAGSEEGETGGGGDAGGECESLIDIVCGSGSFGHFCDALQAANLDQEFEDETWTFFIPNDEAFNSVDYILEQLTDEQIVNILFYHVVKGEVLTSEDIGCDQKTTMYQGSDSETKCSEDGGLYIFGEGNQALFYNPQIIQTDIEFCNGVAHVVDGLLIPGFFDA